MTNEININKKKMSNKTAKDNIILLYRIRKFGCMGYFSLSYSKITLTFSDDASSGGLKNKGRKKRKKKLRKLIS